MPFELPALPYTPTALEPHMSSKTFDFHYGKHHKAYVDTLNALVAGTPHENATLESIIAATYGDDSKAKIFNNAAQIWNHTFFWNSMKPQGGGAPTGALAQRIDADFGGLDAFKAKFKDAALTQFGSGWAWLVVNKEGKLDVAKTANAVTPSVLGLKPLLTCDVWEHAYYIDYQNRRGDMVQAFLDHLVNWDFAAKNLGA
ncbi:MAG: superoxide dismutase [Alphaproteobacteria bacterium]|nr:superoxide dismutase [Alphaproteobacteria bacterium]MBV8549308.1 superoxide dismutase [Alphaproteobacteria bacterium]